MDIWEGEQLENLGDIYVTKDDNSNWLSGNV